MRARVRMMTRVGSSLSGRCRRAWWRGMFFQGVSPNRSSSEGSSWFIGWPWRWWWASLVQVMVPSEAMWRSAGRVWTVHPASVRAVVKDFLMDRLGRSMGAWVPTQMHRFLRWVAPRWFMSRTMFWVSVRVSGSHWTGMMMWSAMVMACCQAASRSLFPVSRMMTWKRLLRAVMMRSRSSAVGGGGDEAVVVVGDGG